MDYPMLDAGLVGSVIAGYRRRAGLSQEVLSGFAGIGRSHLSAIECGERKPTLETFYRLCTAMNLRMSDVAAAIEREMDARNGREA